MKWLLVLILAGCSVRSVVVQGPVDKSADAAVTALWRDDIQRIARDGDWLLTRSSEIVGDELSHASIYDAKHGTVIEAAGEAVREVPVAELLGRNHYVIVVRPSGMTAEEQHEALERARTMLGRGFDKGASELVYWASQTEARSGVRPNVIAPSDLMQFGEVIYWSGKRDDRHVQAVAGERARNPQATR